jgi:hypothetical protein
MWLHQLQHAEPCNDPPNAVNPASRVLPLTDPTSCHFLGMSGWLSVFDKLVIADLINACIAEVDGRDSDGFERREVLEGTAGAVASEEHSSCTGTLRMHVCGVGVPAVADEAGHLEVGGVAAHLNSGASAEQQSGTERVPEAISGVLLGSMGDVSFACTCSPHIGIKGSEEVPLAAAHSATGAAAALEDTEMNLTVEDSTQVAAGATSNGSGHPPVHLSSLLLEDANSQESYSRDMHAMRDRLLNPTRPVPRLQLPQPNHEQPEPQPQSQNCISPTPLGTGSSTSPSRTASADLQSDGLVVELLSHRILTEASSEGMHAPARVALTDGLLSYRLGANSCFSDMSSGELPDGSTTPSSAQRP